MWDWPNSECGFRIDRAGFDQIFPDRKSAIRHRRSEIEWAFRHGMTRTGSKGLFSASRTTAGTPGPRLVYAPTRSIVVARTPFATPFGHR